MAKIGGLTGTGVKVLLSCVLLGLVVIFLFPFFEQPQITDHRPPDISHLKQIALGMTMYSSDSDDRFPLARNWMDALQPYTRNIQIFHSNDLPESTGQHQAKDPNSFGFAFRKRLASVNQTKIATPELVALVFDSSDLSKNASGDLDLLPNPARHQPTHASPFNNISFADGHTKGIPSPPIGVK